MWTQKDGKVEHRLKNPFIPERNICVLTESFLMVKWKAWVKLRLTQKYTQK